MKTISHFKLVFLAVTFGLVCSQAFGQGDHDHDDDDNNYSGLVFKNPTLQSGTNLQLNAVYLFKNVKSGVDATVTISQLVGGATVTKIDDNSGGVGYLDAFQPEVSSPNGLGQSYAVFTIAFVNGGGNPKTIDNVKATALDIDGSLLMKEFASIDMNGGVMNFLSSTLDISVLNLLLRKFEGTNILGIEKTGIDTAAMGNMFTVSQSAVQSFTVTAGTKRLVGSWGGARQFSFYMKGFNYVAPIITLPVTMVSFTAALRNNTVDLAWETANEKNVDKFVVEKGYDGKSFSDAGIVFAYGNTTGKSTYSFPDQLKNNNAGAVYYRLRSEDIDGKFQYSEVRMVRLSKLATGTVTIASFPNPVTAALNVTIPATWQGKKVSYQLLNNSGQQVVRKDAGQAGQTETLQVAQLPVGFYIMRVSCGDEVAQQKIIKN